MNKTTQTPSELVSFIKSELSRREQKRLPFEWQWRLNADFMSGNQSCDIDPVSGGVESYSPEFDWQERMCFNRIAPLMETRLANLKRVNYSMRAESRTGEPDDSEKAAVSTALLSYIQSSEDFNAVKNTLISWAELTGSAFVMSFWSQKGGEEDSLSGADEERVGDGENNVGIIGIGGVGNSDGTDGKADAYGKVGTDGKADAYGKVGTDGKADAYGKFGTDGKADAYGKVGDDGKSFFGEASEKNGGAEFFLGGNADKKGARATVGDRFNGSNGSNGSNRSDGSDGDIRLVLLTPYEIYPESVDCENISDQHSIIVRQVMSREAVYDLYGVEADGQSISRPVLTPLPLGSGIWGSDTAEIDDSVYVTTYFERHSRRHPEGRTVIIIGDSLYYDGDLPYDCIPIVQIKSISVAGQFFGGSVISSLIPLQRAYNGIRNKLLDYAKAVGMAKLLVQEGSVDDVDILRQSSPGEPVLYRAGHTPPTVLNFGEVPDSLIADYRQYASDMEYVAGTSQLMVTGSTPSGVTSGTAIDNLRQIDSTRMSQTAENIRHGVVELARMWLGIYRRCASIEKICRLCGTDSIGAALTWFNGSLSDEDIVFVAENELLHPREEQRREFMALYSAGVFADESGKVPVSVKRRAAELYGIADSYELSGVDLLQSQAAKRENSLCRSGILPSVSEFDDHAIHYDEHLRFYLHAEFSVIKARYPERARLFEEHMKTHLAMGQNDTLIKGAENGQIT